MKMYSIDEILSALKEIANECDRVTSGNVSHEIPKIKMGILNWCRIAEEQQIGWRSASELPPLNECGISDAMICIAKDYAVCRSRYYKDSGWDYNVERWCYPPEEYKVRP